MESDLGIFRAGEAVWFRGKYVDTYSVRGTVEEVMQDAEGATLYGVRLEHSRHQRTW